MTLAEFARHVGVSRQAVHQATNGPFGQAVSWGVAGGKRVATIADLPRALELWHTRPGARVVEPDERKTPPEGDPLSDIAIARLQFEGYRALRERLDYEEKAGTLIEASKAMAEFGKQIAEAKTAIMAVGRKARSCIPHLTTEDVITIEDLCREALEGLAADAIGGDAAADKP